MLIDVSEGRSTSIFRFEEQAKQEIIKKQVNTAAAFRLLLGFSFMIYSSTLKMEADCSPETSVNFHSTLLLFTYTFNVFPIFLFYLQVFFSLFFCL
jgi:hypothetical protein